VSVTVFGLRVTYSGRRGSENSENRTDQILNPAKYTPRADFTFSRLGLLVFNSVQFEESPTLRPKTSPPSSGLKNKPCKKPKEADSKRSDFLGVCLGKRQSRDSKNKRQSDASFCWFRAWLALRH
jgi:hypothetical protein